jgi:uncharacterized protein YdeI (YjbR/CyaY-like superfamily)
MKEDKNPWNKTNQWVEELEILKNIINKTQLEEATKWGGTVYTHNSKNVLGIGGFKSYFGLWFFNGAFLKDEQKVLSRCNPRYQSPAPMENEFKNRNQRKTHSTIYSRSY